MRRLRSRSRTTEKRRASVAGGQLRSGHGTAAASAEDIQSPTSDSEMDPLRKDAERSYCLSVDPARNETSTRQPDGGHEQIRMNDNEIQDASDTSHEARDVTTPLQNGNGQEIQNDEKPANQRHLHKLPITAKDVEGRPFLWVDQEKKEKKRDGLCCLYWLFVVCILLLISFTIWLSVQLAHRHKMAMIRRKANKVVKNPFTFDDIFNSSLSYRSFSVDWVKGKDIYVFEQEDGIYAFDIVANETELLVDRTIMDQLKASKYYVSNDLRYVLLAYEVKSVWRHSFLAKYKIYDRTAPTRQTRLIDFPNDDLLRNTPLQYVAWAPTGTGMVFVTGNNVYYQGSPEHVAQQVTTTGEDKTIFNGVADWLYEEEILGSHVANWWSDDGRLLCYGMFNDSDVPMFKFQYYGPKTDVYGRIIEIAYPKAGHLTPGENSRGYLYVFNVSQLSEPHVMLQPPAELADVDNYFTKVSWRDSVTLTVVWSNRPQNRTITTVCNVNTGVCTENTHRTAVNGWIDPDPPIVHIEAGQAYLTILPRIVLSTGTWSHLAYITSRDNVEGATTFLTDGQQEIKAVAGFEAERSLVYYISTDGDPRKRHLFRVGTPAADPEFQTPECLTCDLSPGYDYVSASFSSSGRYYILSLRGPQIPHYYLKATQYSLSQLLEDNADIEANLAEKTLPVKQYIQVPIGGGYTGWAEILIPPEATEPGNNLKFPLLVETYAGPGSQAVDFRFDIGFDTYMVSTNNVVYVRIDGRGTTSRGDSFKHLVYRKLATLEIDDQIAGARYLRDNLDYIDSTKRPGIWGWSYGGFATAHAVANIANFFQCGMIGAALSDRRYYDTAHTERFMGYATPDDNAAGYDGTDVMRKVPLFANKTLLIVHGTADDNVHFASSMQLIKSLTEAEIQFRLQVYPDQNHYFSRSSRHLYRLYSDFWLKDCWAFNSQAKVEYVTINISEQFKLT